jgi:hypothetical protein
MAKPKWQLRLQSLLEGNPLWILPNTTLVCSGCKPADVKGTKVTVRTCVNFAFNKCDVCHKEYR